MRELLFILALGALALTACAPDEGRVAVQEAWARPSAAGSNAAVYLLLTNGSSSADVLLGASGDLARAVEIHQSIMAEDAAEDGEDAMHHDHGDMATGGDVMQMRPVESLSLTAGENVTFEPGGYHVMLIEIDRDLELGDTFEIRLHFEQAGDVPVQVEVAER